MPPQNRTIIEGKREVKDKTTVSELSQTFATAITFGKIQHQRHRELHTFPTLRVDPTGIDFVLHNAKNDQLILFPSQWSHNTFFYLWLVLHHNIFKFKLLPAAYGKCVTGVQEFADRTGAFQEEPKYLVNKDSFKGQEEVLWYSRSGILTETVHS